jgi:hypothetical protein
MRIKQTTKDVGFRPIEVTLVIETQEEYEALVYASKHLDVYQMNTGYSMCLRLSVVNLLKTIAEGLECQK